MSDIPHIPGFDNTFAFAKEGYNFISKRCKKYNTDIFKTRLMLSSVVCLQGEEAAQQFYDTNLFKRNGAAPKRLQKTLFGEGGVQALDGDAHRHRKQAFMSLMTAANIGKLTDELDHVWQHQIAKWQNREQVEFFYEANELLCRAACTWAGVPLQENEVGERTQGFMSLINSGGAIGPKHWRGRHARKKMNDWAQGLIEQIRAGTFSASEGTAAQAFASHRDLQGNLLDARTAGVELLNIIRPTVAVSRYLTFAALALHNYPQWRERTGSGRDEDITWFVQEVRRFYPFFPVVTAISKTAFDWRGYHFPEGQWVLLDLYGTNHDARTWENPHEFQPERFSQWDGSPFNFIPQGGGEHHQNHRCAGEWITIAVIKQAVRYLTQAMDYQVPPQNLNIDPRQMPALPESGFIITKVRARAVTNAPRSPSSAADLNTWQKQS